MTMSESTKYSDVFHRNLTRNGKNAIVNGFSQVSTSRHVSPRCWKTAASRVEGATQHSVGPIAATLEGGKPLKKLMSSKDEVEVNQNMMIISIHYIPNIYFLVMCIHIYMYKFNFIQCLEMNTKSREYFSTFKTIADEKSTARFGRCESPFVKVSSLWKLLSSIGTTKGLSWLTKKTCIY